MFFNSVSYLTDEQEMMIKSEMLSDLFFDEYFVNTNKFRLVDKELNNVLSIVSNWYDNADYGESTVFEINECNIPVYSILFQYRLLKKYKNISIDKVIVILKSYLIQ